MFGSAIEINITNVIVNKSLIQLLCLHLSNILRNECLKNSVINNWKYKNDILKINYKLQINKNNKIKNN